MSKIGKMNITIPDKVKVALAGNILINLTKDPIATNEKGKKYYLKDLSQYWWHFVYPYEDHF